MKKGFFFICCFLLSCFAVGQNFELVDRKDTYKANFSQLVKIALKIKNLSDKPYFYVIRKVRSDLSESQKGYFCLERNCLEPSIVEFSKKVEPGETINLDYTLETGIQPVQNTLKFEVFPKGNFDQVLEHNVSIMVEERTQQSIFQTKDITIHDVYPNPAQDHATIDYKINNELYNAKIVMYNILGKPLGDYELPANDTQIKIQTDELPSGVYFYTLYLNNNGVLTRKIIVRR